MAHLAAVLAIHVGLFLTVDMVAVAARRRSLGASAGRRLRAVLAQLGSVYDKLGQAMAARARVVPSPMLAGLDASVAGPRSLKPVVARAAIEAAFGPVAERFSEFDDCPIMVTPVAQLHSATLADGRHVVVKVRRPGLVEELGAQRRALAWLASLASRLLPEGVSVDRTGLVAAMTAAYADELDFRVEAERRQRLADVAAASRSQGVVVVAPPIPELVSDGVLVVNRLEGRPLEKVPHDEVAPFLRRLVEGVLQTAAAEGIFPVDLMAANLVALHDGRVGVLDLADSCLLSDGERVGLGRLLDAIAGGDPRRLVHALDVLGGLGDDVDRRAVVARLEWARRQRSSGLWERDVLHDVPSLYLLFAGIEIELPAWLLRLGQGLLHLQATARALEPGFEWGPHLEATWRPALRRLKDPYGPPLTDSEVAAAAAPTPAARTPRVRDVSRLVPARIRAMVRPSRRNLANLLPVLAFLVLNIAYGLSWGIVGAFGGAVGLLLWRRRHGEGQPSRKVWAAVVVLAIPAGAGVALDSQVAFFGPQIIPPGLIGIVLVGSVLVGRPLLAAAAQYVWPQPRAVQRQRRYTMPYTALTLVFGGLHLVQFAVLAWFLLAASASEFVIVQQVLAQIAMPVFFATVWGMALAARRAPRFERRILGA